MVAALNSAPLLLVEPPAPAGGDIIPDDTKDELTRLKPIKKIVVIGGTAAVSASVFNQLKTYATDVERVAGDNRYDTAAMLSGLVPAKAKDADLLDGLDSTDFASSDVDCGSGARMQGIDANGQPICAFTGFLLDSVTAGSYVTADSGEVVCQTDDLTVEAVVNIVAHSTASARLVDPVIEVMWIQPVISFDGGATWTDSGQWTPDDNISDTTYGNVAANDLFSAAEGDTFRLGTQIWTSNSESVLDVTCSILAEIHPTMNYGPAPAGGAGAFAPAPTSKGTAATKRR